MVSEVSLSRIKVQARRQIPIPIHPPIIMADRHPYKLTKKAKRRASKNAAYSSHHIAEPSYKSKLSRQKPLRTNFQATNKGTSRTCPY